MRPQRRVRKLTFDDVLNDFAGQDSFPVSVELVESRNHGESSVNRFSLRNDGTATLEATAIERFQPVPDASAPVHLTEQWCVLELPPGKAMQDEMAVFSRPLKLIVYGPYDLETGEREVLGIYSSEDETERDQRIETLDRDSRNWSAAGTDPPSPSDNELYLAIYTVMDALKGDRNAWQLPSHHKRWQPVVTLIQAYEGYRGIAADELLWVEDAAFFHTTAMRDSEGNLWIVEVTLSKERDRWHLGPLNCDHLRIDNRVFNVFVRTIRTQEQRDC